MGERSDGYGSASDDGPMMRRHVSRGAGASREPEPEETVECFFSGKQLPRSQAVLVKVGSGMKVWAACDLFREG